MTSASSRSASSRASRAISSSSWERTTPSVALVTVSSSRSTIWPASTSSPSLTRISPTTPPVGCCTFFTLDSTTMVPGAITAPANWVVAAQPPTPPTSSTVIANPDEIELSDRAARVLGHFWPPTVVSLTTLRLPTAAGWGAGRAVILRTHLIARPELLLLPVGKHQQVVANGQHRRPMRDQHDDGAARLEVDDRLAQRALAFVVEIGIRLVEHNEKGVAKERARQSDALSLSARERFSSFADRGVIAVRQPEDHIVCAGGAGRTQHSIGIRLDAHSCDVFRDGAVEQLDRLRDEADMLAELLRIPVVERGTVQAHVALGRPPDAHESAHQRSLAGTARPDDAQCLSALPSRIRFSTLAESVKLAEEKTVSLPSPTFSTALSSASSTK